MTNATIRAEELARKDRTSTTLDQLAFFSAFLLGTIAIVGLKTVHMSQILVTAAPVALMVLYLGYVLWSRRFALGDDRIGDNLYYLGFLFTLVSIAYSLYEFTTSSGDAAYRIIVNFGIALATTIVGVALRVTLMQVRGDPAEVERVARMSLTEAAIRMRSELDISIQTLTAARLANEQAITETTKSAVEKTLAAMEESTADFAALVAEGSAAIETGFETFRANAAALNRASASTVAAAEKLSVRIDAIEAPKDLLERKLDGIVSQLDEAALSLKSAAAEAAGVSGGLAEATGALTAQAAALKEAAQEQRRHVEELRAADPGLRELADRWAELARTIDRQRAVMAGGASLNSDLLAVQAQRDAIRKHVDEAAGLLIEMERALVSTARHIVEQVNAAH